MSSGDEETTDSKKLSERDKKEIQEGACVNCAIASIIVTILTMVLMLV